MALRVTWLEHLLHMTPVTGRLDLRCQYGAPWRIAQPPLAPGLMAYHIMLEGSASLLDAEGTVVERLSTGDIVILTRGEAHGLHHGLDVQPGPSFVRSVASTAVDRNGAQGASVDVLCGQFAFEPLHARFLQRYLPTRLIVRSGWAAAAADAKKTDALHTVIAMMNYESHAELQGGRAVLDALSAVLFALTLRLSSQAADAPAGLLALAGCPTLTPALDAMIQDPGLPWTLSLLAERCSVSRATFVRLLKKKFGTSVMQLLLDVRMLQSANSLRRTRATVGKIANSMGYRSEKAFRRAFQSYMGQSPAQWRKQYTSPMGSATAKDQSRANA